MTSDRPELPRIYRPGIAYTPSKLSNYSDRFRFSLTKTLGTTGERSPELARYAQAKHAPLTYPPLNLYPPPADREYSHPTHTQQLPDLTPNSVHRSTFETIFSRHILTRASNPANRQHVYNASEPRPQRGLVRSNSTPLHCIQYNTIQYNTAGYRSIANLTTQL